MRDLPIPAAARRAFTPGRFWRKLGNVAKRAGREVVEKALWLYFAAQRPETPRWARATVFGALGYFILPTDAIPDLAPLVGYTDDLAVLASAVGIIAFYIDDGVRARTRELLDRWFGGEAQAVARPPESPAAAPLEGPDSPDRPARD